MRFFPPDHSIYICTRCLAAFKDTRKALICPECGHVGKQSDAEAYGGIRVITDTREQLAFHFPPWVTNTVDTLHTADYALDTDPPCCLIERKSKADLYGSLTRGRARLEAEFIRMMGDPMSTVLIECSWAEILVPLEWEDGNGKMNTSKVNPTMIVNSLISWQMKYGIRIVCCDTRKLARDWALKYLELAWKYHVRGVE